MSDQPGGTTADHFGTQALFMLTAVKKYFLPIQKDCVSLQFEN